MKYDEKYVNLNLYSAFKAIENSAPIQVEPEFLNFPKKFKVTLVYDLK